MTIHIHITGSGKPLVLFHGWGFDGQIWQSVLPRLPHYQVFCVDLPGFGLTPLMDWETFKTNLLSQLPERFILAGWSLGGLLATRLAIDTPSRVSYLLNVASSPYFIQEDIWPGVQRQVFSEFYQQLQDNAHQVLSEFLSLQLPKNATLCLHIQEMSGLAWGLEVLLNWDLRPELTHLSMPVTYLFGRLDAIVSRRLLPVMRERYPAFHYRLVDKAAHAIFLSHPEEFVRALAF